MKKLFSSSFFLILAFGIFFLAGASTAQAVETCRFVIKGRLKATDVFTNRKWHSVNAYKLKTGGLTTSSGMPTVPLLSLLTEPQFAPAGFLDSYANLINELEAVESAGGTVWQEPVLPRVKVQLKATSVAGGLWKVWQTKTTDSNGSFTFTVDKSDTLTDKFCSKGVYVKISAQFDGKDFEIRQVKPDFNPFSNIVPLRWYAVLDSTYFHPLFPGSYDFTAPFSKGKWVWGGDTFFFTLNPKEDNPAQAAFGPTIASDLSDPEPYYHANIWYVLDKVAAYFRAFGAPYAFQTKFTAKTGDKQNLCNLYEDDDIAMSGPVRGILYLPTKDLVINENEPENAASAPISLCGILPRDTESIGDYYAILHEVMHIWAYQHSMPHPGGGKKALVDELIEQKSPHGYAKREQVGFHEGFAAFAGTRLLEMLVGNDLKSLYGSVDFTKLRYGGKDFGLMPRYPMNRYRTAQRAKDLDDESVLIHLAYKRDLIDNFDDHWASALNLLLTRDIQKYFLGTMTVTASEGIPPYVDAISDCDGNLRDINKGYCDRTVAVTDKKIDVKCSNKDYKTFACKAEDAAYKYQAASGCEIKPWTLSFQDVLTVFLANPTAGYPDPLDDEDMTLIGFLTRASKILPTKFSTAQKQAVWQLINPVETKQPKDVLRCSIQPATTAPISPIL